MQAAPAPRAAPPAWLTSRPIAHRGLHDRRAPENTCAAFEAALRAGYAIELDLHVLPDREVIVFHDADLARATGEARPLWQESRASIARRRVFGTDERIPTLREVLALVDGRVPLLIEIKARGGGDVLVPPIVALLADYTGPFALQSFDPWVLAALHRRAPRFVRGQLGGALRGDALRPAERFASHRLLTLLISRAQFVNFELGALPDRWVAGVSRALSLPLLAWTVRNAEEQRKAEALGVNYVFDHVRP